MSKETKDSVSDVSSLISNINSHVEKFTNIISKIGKEVGNGNINMQTTENLFNQILHAMSETMLQNNKIQNEIVKIVKEVNDIGEAFEEVTLSADNLKTIIN